jgi:hypothetical protein
MKQKAVQYHQRMLVKKDLRELIILGLFVLIIVLLSILYINNSINNELKYVVHVQVLN